MQAVAISGDMARPILLCVLLVALVEAKRPGVAEQRGEVIAWLTQHLGLRTVLLLRRENSCKGLNESRILWVGKLEGKKPLGRPRRMVE